MVRIWIPELTKKTHELAVSAFDQIASDPDFRLVIEGIYEKHQPSLKYVNTDFLIQILVQDLLEKCDNLNRLEVSQETLAALKESKRLIEAAAATWKEKRAYACTLLVVLTLRKMALEGLLRLEIQD